MQGIAQCGALCAYRTLLTVCLLQLFASVAGYKTGAPFSTCLTMFPKHDRKGYTERQTGPSPFTLSLTPPAYRSAGDIVTVELRSSVEGRRFKGLLVRASRLQGDRQHAVGTFVQWPANLTKIFTCEGSYKSAVTHTAQMAEEGTLGPVVFKWKAPAENFGNILFVVTIVENYTTFWTNISTILVTEMNSEVVPPSHPVTDIPTDRFNDSSDDFSTCGVDKGCFLYPGYCKGPDCAAVVSFTWHPTGLLFELMVNDTAASYVSVGFSRDMFMGDDETVTCTVDASGVSSVHHGFNTGHRNLRIVTHQLSGLKAHKSERGLLCAFQRPLVTVTRTVNQTASGLAYIEKTWNLTEDFHLMIAWGTVKKGTDVINKHTGLPPVTTSKVSFKTYAIYRGTALPSAVRAHGSLMVIAWVVVVAMTTAMSRYYRHWMAGRSFCGTRIWFQLHRGTGIAAAVFIVSSIIVIFAYVGGFVDGAKKPEAFKHSVMGMIVICLLVLQITVGFVRPKPRSDLRPYFKWGHMLLGQAVHILSAVTMFLAFNVEYLPTVMRKFGVATLTAWVTVQIAWNIVLELRRCCTVDEDVRKIKKETIKQVLKSVDTVLLALYCLSLLVVGAATLFAVLIY